MIRKLEVSLAVLVFVAGVSVAAAAVPENATPEAAVPAATAVERPTPSAASEPSKAELAAFLDRLAGATYTGGSFCPPETCNRPLDCFVQGTECGWGEAAWCWGYPNVTNCEGYCGCM